MIAATDDLRINPLVEAETSQPAHDGIQDFDSNEEMSSIDHRNEAMSSEHTIRSDERLELELGNIPCKHKCDKKRCALFSRNEPSGSAY